MSYETFGDVAALGATSQRELLRRGTPLERIWAAWALGLHLGRTAAPDLLRGLQSSPDPGTRRHLIIMLAGLGERTVLITLAEHDPNEFVRATACQYLGRVALPGDAEVATFLCARLVEDRSSEVRQALLRLALDHLLPRTMAQTTLHLQDPERAIRQLAIDVLRATYPTDRLFPGPLETHLLVESEAEIRADLIAASIAAGRAERLLHLALNSDGDLRLALAYALAQTGQSFIWAQIAPLASLQQPILDQILLDLLNTDDAGSAFGWLLFCVARSLSWPWTHDHEVRKVEGAVWSSAAKAQKLFPLALPVAPSLTAQQREYVGIIIADLENWERLAELPDDEQDDDPWYPDEEQLQLLDDLRILLRQSS